MRVTYNTINMTKQMKISIKMKKSASLVLTIGTLIMRGALLSVSAIILISQKKLCRFSEVQGRDTSARSFY